jgi:hypothetical protein
MVTSQAVETPTTMTPQPTPRHSHRVLATYSGSTVAARCAQVSPVPTANRLAQTLAMGAAARTAMTSAARASAFQPRKAKRVEGRVIVVVCIGVVRQTVS